MKRRLFESGCLGGRSATLKNSKIMITGHFDNARNNRHNPDPNQTVYYGDMNWEEMFSGFIGLILDKDVDPRKILREDVPESATATGGGG